MMSSSGEELWGGISLDFRLIMKEESWEKLV